MDDPESLKDKEIRNKIKNVPKLPKEKFRNYLSLIFSDLCAKDNGLNAQQVHYYSFLKVIVASYNFNPLVHKTSWIPM